MYIVNRNSEQPRRGLFREFRSKLNQAADCAVIVSDEGVLLDDLSTTTPVPVHCSCVTLSSYSIASLVFPLILKAVADVTLTIVIVWFYLQSLFKY